MIKKISEIYQMTSDDDFSAVRCAVAQSKIAQLEKEVKMLWQQLSELKNARIKEMNWLIGLLVTALGAILANKFL